MYLGPEGQSGSAILTRRAWPHSILSSTTADPPKQCHPERSGLRGPDERKFVWSSEEKDLLFGLAAHRPLPRIVRQLPTERRFNHRANILHLKNALLISTLS